MPKERGVAVIGWACRLPGAPDVEALWRQALSARHAFRRLERQRWDHAALYDPSPRARDKTPTTQAALVDAVELFAGAPFECSAMRADATDPQQRLLLELARDALLEAGLPTRPLDRDLSATFVGISTAEYRDLSTVRSRVQQMAAGQFGEPVPDWRSVVERALPACAYTLPGQLLSLAASNLAQAFDLRGPAAALDAACASGLIAVAQGVRHLRSLPPRRRKADPAPVVLAAAAHLVLVPDSLVGFSRLGALAVDRCRPYDAEASGFLPGEGAGVLVLKRLGDALQDGDHVHAVIRGVSWTNDGAGGSQVSPCSRGQRRVVELGLADAGWRPADVAYLEGHGTATAVGDRQELEVLGDLWDGHPAVLASAKGSVGHALPASGLVGLLRAGLAVQRGALLPSAGWERFPEGAGTRLRVLREAEPWSGRPRRAGVCSFGFGGHNCFVALEEPPARPAVTAPRKPLALVASAEDPDLLRLHLRDLAEAVARLEPGDLGPAAWSLAAGRVRGPAVAVVHASTPEEAAAALREAARRLEASKGSPPGPEPAGAPPVEARPRAHRRVVPLPSPPVWRKAAWVVRDVAPPSTPAPDDAVLAPETHPFLDQHRPSGRAVLPLAAALDRMAWAAGLAPPFALGCVRVHRLPLCRESMRLRVEREGSALTLVEVREDRVNALVSARIHPGFATLPPAPTGVVDPPVEDLADFYREAAFHGPLLQALEEVRLAGPGAAVATVRTCPPQDWWPEDPRPAWSLDPMLVDGCMQLGLYLASRVLQRALLPYFADEVAVLKPLDEPRYQVHLQVSRQTSDEVTCEVRIESGRGAVAWIRGLRGRFANL